MKGCGGQMWTTFFHTVWKEQRVPDCLSSVCHSVAEKHHLLGGFLSRFMCSLYICYLIIDFIRIIYSVKITCCSSGLLSTNDYSDSTPPPTEFNSTPFSSKFYSNSTPFSTKFHSDSECTTFCLSKPSIITPSIF